MTSKSVINSFTFSLIFIPIAIINKGSCISLPHSNLSKTNEIESTTPLDVDIEFKTYTEKFSASLACDCGTTPFQSLVAGFEKLSIMGEHKLTKQLQEPFILGGVKVQRGDLPWMVAITKYQHKKIPRWRVVCGGVVISERYILTAAHCLHDRYKDTLEVVFNVDDATKILEDENVIRRKIKRFIIHPKFNIKTIDNDIALIEIVIPLDFSTNSVIRPICIPTNVKKDFYANKIGTVSGWGKTKYSGSSSTAGENSPHLLKVELPILTRIDCLNTKVSSKNNITENMICVGVPTEGGKDACLNDSGGPLIVQENNQSVLVGIISWGIGCGLIDYPGVYTNVPNYVTWIHENSQREGCDGLTK